MKLVVGLGNPGKSYDKTRHNIGFMIIDYYLNNEKMQEKYNSLYCKKLIKNEIVFFVKPQTFMNLSGNSVREFVNFYDINSNDILIIHDDIDLDFDTYRIKFNSSSGGHNGIKSIISQLGTSEFGRLKIGINTEKKGEIKDFVLKKFSKEELKVIDNKYELYGRIIDSFIEDGIDKTMNLFNRK